ncbi:MAG TPA: caspase family protein, partial [Chitinophagaceae bacterium]|nr:caspase family protein [Chitinophagaceae bacterium]
MAQRSLYATLIGINAYPQNPLGGCIKDVLDIDLLLREQCAQQDGLRYAPAYFLAPNKTDETRIRQYEEGRKLSLNPRPATFAAITGEAFAHLKEAKSGDVVVLYYSGHGSQAEAPEEFWHTKPDRQNETLVCADSR